MEKYYFTSEQVTEGHPDKICDQISDAILDECLKQDPLSRVACETTAWTDAVHVMGEITTKAKVDFEKVARDTVEKIGYVIDDIGFNKDIILEDVYFTTRSYGGGPTEYKDCFTISNSVHIEKCYVERSQVL